MKTLRRNKEGIYNTAQNYHRKFSAIAKGARADRSRHQECLVLVEIRDTYTPLLHQILQSCARTGEPMEVDCAGKVFDEMPQRSLYKQLHALAVKLAMNLNVYVGIALLDVYAKSGLIKDASCVLASLPERSLAALIEGKQVHAVLCKTGFGLNIFIVSSLIDMYAKCGSIKEAYYVFRGMDETNTVLWNTMISGFARHACSLEVMILFEKMQQMGRFPSEVTYVSVLTACSHMGLIESGRKYFNLMITEHNASPTVVHYTCMVDLFGRSGLLFEVYNLIEEIPFDATASMWDSLLASCRIHGKLHLAEVAAKHLSEIEPNNAGNHILLSNIYAANKKWDEVARTRKLLKEKLKIMGYTAETEHDLHYMGENRKHEPLRHHSEKLALTLGLMCLPSNASIRIMKNLRICGDCHSFMKLHHLVQGRKSSSGVLTGSTISRIVVVLVEMSETPEIWSSAIGIISMGPCILKIKGLAV
ncbi:unnamed protein product [Prunus armeniaca]